MFFCASESLSLILIPHMQAMQLACGHAARHIQNESILDNFLKRAKEATARVLDNFLRRAKEATGN